MNTDKRVLVAILLSIAVWLLYESFLAPPRQVAPPPAQVQPQQSAAQEAPSLPRHVPDAAPAIETPALPAENEQAPHGQTITVHNSLYRMVLSDCQAAITSVRLFDYKESLPPPAVITWFRKTFKLQGDTDTHSARADNFKEMVALMPPDPLPIKTAFVYPNGTLAAVPEWRADTDSSDIDVQGRPASLVFNGFDQNLLQFSRRFEFNPDDYKITFDMVITNTSSTRIEGNPFLEWTELRPPKPSGGFFSSSGLSGPRFTYLIKDSTERKDLHDIREEIIIQGDEVSWTAIEEKFFISAVIPENQRPAQVRLSSGDRIVSYKLIYPYVQLEPGQSQMYRFALYIGPRDINILLQQNARLERAVDFGWFDIISKPLLLSLKFFNGFLHNYGLSIILLTIIIKILFWPLTNKSFKSMKGMQKLQPEIAALKEKHKDNREEFARQQMELFKRYKVNPLGGCLPMLLQIPVFIALYRALMDSIELRHANFISFWINDLSAKDPTYIAPLLMGASMFLQQKMTPTTLDPAQARIMMFMPVIFTFMFLNFPAGLVIYWLVNNLISIAQQVYINKQHTDAGGIQCSPSTLKPKQPRKR
ncbi:MAG: membrane protein insertase YidC [Deltaproteobacteria bacterium]|nr:membrane protein insertase YidC [Deltaproteobacteria bacterium]